MLNGFMATQTEQMQIHFPSEREKGHFTIRLLGSGLANRVERNGGIKWKL